MKKEQKHYIVKAGNRIEMEFETISKHKDKIPVLLAIAHSGFSPEDWDKVLHETTKTLTMRAYERLIGVISTAKKRNSEFMAM